jgi:hypothetical protein
MLELLLAEESTMGILGTIAGIEGATLQPELLIPTLILMAGLATFKGVKNHHEKKARE